MLIAIWIQSSMLFFIRAVRHQNESEIVYNGRHVRDCVKSAGQVNFSPHNASSYYRAPKELRYINLFSNYQLLATFFRNVMSRGVYPGFERYCTMADNEVVAADVIYQAVQNV